MDQQQKFFAEADAVQAKRERARTKNWLYPFLKALFFLVLIGAVLGGLGWLCWDHVKGWGEIPSALGPNPSPPKEGVNPDSVESLPPETLLAAKDAAPASIIGEPGKLGHLSVRVEDFEPQAAVTAQGVAYALLCAYIGNASNGPIKLPDVNVSLLDEDGRRHAHDKAGGEYRVGMELNPGLARRHLWAFVVPAGARMQKALFLHPATKQHVTVNLEQRTAENLAGRKAHEEARREADLKTLKLDLGSAVAAMPARNAARDTAEKAALDRQAKAQAALSAALDTLAKAKEQQETKSAELDVLRKETAKKRKQFDGCAGMLDQSNANLQTEKKKLALCEARIRELGGSLSGERKDVSRNMFLKDAYRNYDIALGHVEKAEEEAALKQASHDQTKKDLTALEVKAKPLDAECAKLQQLIERTEGEIRTAETQLGNN